MFKRTLELVVNTTLLVWAHVVWMLALLLAWGGFALAQTAEPFPVIDPTGWGASPFVFGAFLTLVVATIKRAVEGWKLERYGQIVSNPWLWRGVVLVLALAGAFGLNIAKYGAELVLFGLVSPWSVVLFGLASALVAMGYRDLLKSALGWIGGPSLPQPAPVPLHQPTNPPPPSGFEPLPFAAFGMDIPLSVDGLVELLLGQLGLAPTPTHLFRIGARLAVVAPDLLDGDPHLSSENRLRILNVIMDLKAQGGLK